LDERLRLGPEDYSPALVRKIVRQGGKDSFTEASQELQEHENLEIGAQQVGRITERVGEEWVALRDREVEAYKRNELPRAYAEKPAAAAVMADGGRLLTRADDQPPGAHAPAWRAPYYGCCLTLPARAGKEDPQPEPPQKFLDAARVPKLVQEVQSRAGVPRTGSGRSPAVSQTPPRRRRGKNRLKKKGVGLILRTVVATMASAEEFGYMLAAEAYRRGLDLAAHKAFVGDGEASNWSIYRFHFAPLGYVGILDFLHLLTYLYSAAQALGGRPAERWERYERWLRWAWGGQRDKLLLALNAAARKVGPAPKNAPENDPRSVVEAARRYITNNAEHMDYPRYRKLGLPISSAPIESVVKQFNRRVKGTEKFWLEAGAEAVLQVRAAYLSQDGRAERYWNMPRPLYRAVGRNRLALAA
jgi:hypothetical protein